MIQFATNVERLGDEIAELAAHIDAATYRLLVLLHEFDVHEGWGYGFRTCAHWLSWRTGIDLGAAREKVRVSRALPELPVLSDAMRTGVLSYSKARALTRVATAANETELLELALHGTTAHVERVVRAWRRVDRLEEMEQEHERHARRGLTMRIDTDGSYVLRGRLDPEAGAVLQRALEMAREELYDRGSSAPSAPKPPDSSQQRSDALGLVAELALRGSSAPAAERFQVVLHVQPDGCTLDSGVRVSAETSRRLSCDASRVVNGGHRTRTVPPSLRRVLLQRDGACRFPGCGSRHCDAHHVKHWADGGETSLANLVLLCRFHHRLLHEDRYSIVVNGDSTFTFLAPNGYIMVEAPAPPALAHDAGIEVLRREQDGLGITAGTAPLSLGGHLDIDLALLALRESPPDMIDAQGADIHLSAAEPLPFDAREHAGLHN